MKKTLRSLARSNAVKKDAKVQERGSLVTNGVCGGDTAWFAEA